MKTLDLPPQIVPNSRHHGAHDVASGACQLAAWRQSENRLGQSRDSIRVPVAFYMPFWFLVGKLLRQSRKKSMLISILSATLIPGALMSASIVAAQEVPDPVAICTAAVHGDLARAVEVCAEPPGPIDVLSPGGLDAKCLAALSAGRTAGRYGPGYSAPMRAGLIRDYDKKEAACRAPKPPPTPERPVTQLWD